MRKSISVLLGALLASSTLVCSNVGAESPTQSAAGLTYQDNVVGSGVQAQQGKKVSVHYTGWLNEKGTKGKKFDSSLDRNRAFSFTLGAGQVIPGWDEGISGMRVGGKRTLYIPSNLAYGARGAGPTIPPNADLIFDVELLSVQ